MRLARPAARAGAGSPLAVDGPRVHGSRVARNWWGWLLPRRTPSPAPRPDPVPIVRSIIAACDGVDRSTVELLAEERGVDAASVSRTLERMRRDGSLRYERGTDGEEVLAWSRLDGA